jgi:hypothetical protein
MGGRLLHWIGPLALLGSTLPVPDTLRSLLALTGVLLGVPLALWPYWWRPTTAPHGGGAGEIFALRVARAAVLLPLPLLFLMAFGLLGVPVSLLGRILLTLQVLSALLGMRRAGQTASDLAAVSPAPRSLIAGIALALLLLGLVAARVGAPLGAEDDALDHLATIRHLIESDRLEMPGAFHAVALPEGVDPRKGVLHLALALAGRISGVAPLDLWHAAPLVLAPLLGLGYLALALSLFGASPLVVTLAVPALLLVGGDPLWILKGAYGGHAGLAFAWAVLAGFLAGGGRLLALAGGAGAAALHAYAPVQVAAPLTMLGLAGLLGRAGADRSRAHLGTVGIFLLGALPVNLGRLLLAPPGENPLHRQAMGWLELGPGPIASPLQLLDWYGLAGAAAIPALLVGALFHDGRGRRYLLASLVAPLLLLLNPWLFLPVAEVAGSVANKLALVWSGALAALWLLLGIADRRTTGPRRFGLILAFALVLAALRPELAPRLAALSRPMPEHPWSLPGEVVELVNDATPETAVIAADPLTSYALPALTGRRTIVTLHQHSPPGDSRSLERLAVANGLLAPCVPLVQALAEARGEGATHLLLAPPATHRLDPYGAHRDPRNAALLIARFEPPQPGLAPLGVVSGFRLFRIDDVGRSADRFAPPIDTGTPPDGARSLRAAGVELAVHSGTLPARTRRGGTLALRVWWRRTVPDSAGAPYREVQAHIRIETDALAPGGSAGLFSKLRRRWIDEPRAGGLLRSRGVELPFRGLCPPDRWPPGVWLGDTLEVVVPQSLVAGSGRVRVSLEEVTLYPRLRLADLLSNEDRFSGPVLGPITIE